MMAHVWNNGLRPRSPSRSVTSYQTQASRDFSSRGSRHRDDNGQLLDTTRRIDSSAMFSTNDLVHPAYTTQALDYFPPDPQFTDTEQLIFALAYQDRPAKFGEISQYLAGRSFEDCVHHYYCNKFDGRFKIQSDRQRHDRTAPARHQIAMNHLPKWDMRLHGVQTEDHVGTGDDEYYNSGRAKRRRGKKAFIPSPRPSVDELNHLAPIEIHIEKCKRHLGISSNVFTKVNPSSRRAQVILPPPLHLDSLSDYLRPLFHMADTEIMHWLRSSQVLPLVREWFAAVVHNERLYSQLILLLEQTCFPYSDQCGDIACLALKYKTWTPPDLGIYYQEVLLKCAQFAYRLGQAFREDTGDVDPDSYSEEAACLDSAFVLLFALEDCTKNPGGFFAILLKSELAWMVRPAVRASWERLYAFEGEELSEKETEAVEDRFEQPAAPDLPLRGQPGWDRIFEYEGEDGKPKDFDDWETFDDKTADIDDLRKTVQKKVARADSGLEL